MAMIWDKVQTPEEELELYAPMDPVTLVSVSPLYEAFPALGNAECIGPWLTRTSWTDSSGNRVREMVKHYHRTVLPGGTIDSDRGPRALRPEGLCMKGIRDFQQTIMP